MTLDATTSDPAHEAERQKILRRILFLIDGIGWRNGNPLTDDQRVALQAVHDAGGCLAKVKRILYPWHLGEQDLVDTLRSLERCPRRVARVGLDGIHLTIRGRRDLLG